MEVRVLRRPEEFEDLAESWDALPVSRGVQGDLYDSVAWLGAWSAADPEGARSLLVPVAIDDDRAVAALPLVVADGIARPAGARWRPRFRVVCGGPELAGAVADRLVAAALQAGARSFALPAMPSRDPATETLLGALERNGLSVRSVTGSADCLCQAASSWDEHRKRFKKYDRTVKNFSNKAARLGELALQRWGDSPGVLSEEAWRAYLDLHGRGWKGDLREPLRLHRRVLFERAARRGWLRVFCLTVAGVRAATIVWMRVGTAAIAYSTVYDERLSALSAGTIVMWRAHEALLAEDTVELLDYLPGHGSQKDQLGVERPPLTNVEAATSRNVVPMLGAVLRRATARLKRAFVDPFASMERDIPGPASRETIHGRFEPLSMSPVENPMLLGEAARPIEPDASVELYLTVTCGYPSPKSMRECWDEGDTWYTLGEPPIALLRVGEHARSSSGCSDPVESNVLAARELVLIDEKLSPREVLVRFAAALRAPLVARTTDAQGGPKPVPVWRAMFPWPGGGGAQRA